MIDLPLSEACESLNPPCGNRYFSLFFLCNSRHITDFGVTPECHSPYSERMRFSVPPMVLRPRQTPKVSRSQSRRSHSTKVKDSLCTGAPFESCALIGEHLTATHCVSRAGRWERMGKWTAISLKQSLSLQKFFSMPFAGSRRRAGNLSVLMPEMRLQRDSLELAALILAPQ